MLCVYLQIPQGDVTCVCVCVCVCEGGGREEWDSNLHVHVLYLCNLHVHVLPVSVEVTQQSSQEILWSHYGRTTRLSM